MAHQGQESVCPLPRDCPSNPSRRASSSWRSTHDCHSTPGGFRSVTATPASRSGGSAQPIRDASRAGGSRGRELATGERRPLGEPRRLCERQRPIVRRATPRARRDSACRGRGRAGAAPAAVRLGDGGQLSERHEALRSIGGIDPVGAVRRLGVEAHHVAAVQQRTEPLVQRRSPRPVLLVDRRRGGRRSTRRPGARTALSPLGTQACARARWCAPGSDRCGRPSPRAGSASTRRAGSSDVRARRCSRSSTPARRAAGSRGRCDHHRSRTTRTRRRDGVAAARRAVRRAQASASCVPGAPVAPEPCTWSRFMSHLT